MEDIIVNFGNESETLEFKTSTNELEEALIDIVAILNKHSKGKLLFGVKNNGDQSDFEIGINTERNISRRIFEAIKPQIFPSITQKELDGKKYIEVDFSGEDKPYSANGRYYIRITDESREMTPGELAKFILKENYSFWEKLASDCTVDDVDEETLRLFLEKAVHSQRMPEMNYDKIKLLSKLNLLSKDGIHLNNAGKYLFSANTPIKVKMAVFATNEKRTFVDISPVEGNIINLIRIVEQYIQKNIHYSVSIVGSERYDIPEIPEKALREIITNSFAHANYLANSQHEVNIFPNRVAIYNPGAFPANYSPEDYIGKNLASQITNVLICDVLFKCKAIESWGTGLKNTYEVCKQSNVQISYLKEQEGFWFIFYRKDAKQIETESPITKEKQTNNSKPAITEIEDLILNEIRKDNHIDRKSLSRITGRSERTIQRVIDSLKQKGNIKRIGSPRNGHWELIE